MKKIYRILLGLSLAMSLLFVACDKNDDLKDRISNVEDRVQAVETQLDNLNKNIEALSELVKAGSINDVKEVDGVYTILLTNGETITLNQGSLGVGTTPIMTIDKDGYWMVDYQDGKGAVNVMSDGKKVKAKGSDGLTPLFGVNEAGNWTVSFDGGENVEEILDVNGKPVQALPGEDATSDTYFEDVNYNAETNEFSLTLKDGNVLHFPVVSSFLISIDNLVDDVQSFVYGESKSFDLTVKGVSQLIITKPDGWKVVVDNDKMNVTAPKAAVTTKAGEAKLATRSISADTKSDIALLAVAESGLATMAKMKVSVSEAPVIALPKIELSLGEVGQDMVSFNANLSNSVSWKYLLQESSVEAPALEKIQADGKEILASQTVEQVNELNPNTNYSVYAIALKEEKCSEIVTLTFKTEAAPEPAIEDYYEAYNAGKDIIIAGEVYNKATFGEPVLLKAEKKDTDCKKNIHKSKGVLFLESTEGSSFFIPTVTEISDDVIIIGRYASKEVVLRPEMFFKLRKGRLIFKNITLDLSEIDGKDKNDNYFLNNANAMEAFGKLHFDNCFIKGAVKPMFYNGNVKSPMVSLKLLNSRMQVKSDAVKVFNLYKTTKLSDVKELEISNNVFFSDKERNMQIIDIPGSIAQDGNVWELVMKFKNNILYNISSKNGFLRFHKLAGLELTNNIFYVPSGVERGYDSYTLILYDETQGTDNMDCTGNKAFGSNKRWILAHSNSKFKPAKNEIEKLDQDPFTSFNTETGQYELK